MATIRSDIKTRASASDVWSAVCDIGALHTQLVPPASSPTRNSSWARASSPSPMAWFCASRSSRSTMRRVGWCGPPKGGRTRHYNAALQVSELADGVTSVVWTVDFLPDDAGGFLSTAIEAGMAAMQRSLDRLAG